MIMKSSVIEFNLFLLISGDFRTIQPLFFTTLIRTRFGNADPKNLFISTTGTYQLCFQTDIFQKRISSGSLFQFLISEPVSRVTCAARWPACWWGSSYLTIGEDYGLGTRFSCNTIRFQSMLRVMI